MYPISWQMVSAIAACVGILVTIVASAITWGALSERIKQNAVALEKHDAELHEHDIQLRGHGERLGRVEEWKSGVSIGVKAATNPM